MTGWWAAGALAALGYGIFLVVVAVQSPSGAELTGGSQASPRAKAAMAVLLAVAAWCHPIRRERRWLVPALLLSAAGDSSRRCRGWEAVARARPRRFPVAHLVTWRAAVLYGAQWPRLAGAAVVVAALWGMLVWFWSRC